MGDGEDEKLGLGEATQIKLTLEYYLHCIKGVGRVTGRVVDSE